MASTESDYVLTIVQHNYCGDCMWIKGKITDVYHASSQMRGEDSKNWRINIISPMWDRNKRALDFPRGFDSIDVPALKLEVDRRPVLATQNPGLINELLLRLKSLLMNKQTNAQIQAELVRVGKEWKDIDGQESCSIAN